MSTTSYASDVLVLSHLTPLPHTPTMDSLNRGRRSFFNSLRHKPSKTEANAVSVSKSMQSPRPHASPAPPTRRPNMASNNPYANASDPPPAYSPVSYAPPTISAPPVVEQISPQAVGSDDPYAFLRSFDTVFLIDDSGSMAGSRWRETADALSAITPICTSHDADGIDIYFLNHPDSPHYHGIQRTGTVREIFETVRPGGGTPTGQRLNQLLKPYLRRYAENPDNTKPMNIICITDGEPSDDVESPLIAAAKKLDKLDAPAWQIGVQFFQVGRDEHARRHLQQLDDELADIAGDDELRDIVDTVPFVGAEGATLTGEGVLKVVLGSVNRRLDRKKAKDLYRST